MVLGRLRTADLERKMASPLVLWFGDLGGSSTPFQESVVEKAVLLIAVGRQREEEEGQEFLRAHLSTLNLLT